MNLQNIGPNYNSDELGYIVANNSNQYQNLNLNSGNSYN